MKEIQHLHGRAFTFVIFRFVIALHCMESKQHDDTRHDEISPMTVSWHKDWSLSIRGVIRELVTCSI